MKATYHLSTLAFLALTQAAAIAQAPQVNDQGTLVLQTLVAGDGNAPAQPPEKPFNLEFPGGPVQAFVAAVEKATGGPFNVIIPASAQELQIPPVRVKGVTLRPLLTALTLSSVEQKATTNRNMSSRLPGGSNIEYYETGFSFTPTEPGPQAVWQLTVRGLREQPVPPPPPPLVRFYQLKPILEAGLKVEDITTAAETAWKMMKLAQAEMPELKFHEETGLLIAAGSEPALMVIDSVLQAQPQQHPARTSVGTLNPGGGLRGGGIQGFSNPTAQTERQPQVLPPPPAPAPAPVEPPKTIPPRPVR